MSQKQRVYDCNIQNNVRCNRNARELNEFDPRTYCHNVCATPEKICSPTICEKFIAQEANEDLQVCTPKRICKIIRYLKCQEDAYLENEYEESENDDYGTRKQQRIKDKLEALKKTIAPEGMAVVYALAGSDICPCCGCTTCECELRKTELFRSGQKQLGSSTENIPERGGAYSDRGRGQDTSQWVGQGVGQGVSQDARRGVGQDIRLGVDRDAREVVDRDARQGVYRDARQGLHSDARQGVESDKEKEGKIHYRSARRGDQDSGLEGGREAGRGTGQDTGRGTGWGAGQDSGREAGRGAGQYAGREASRGAGQDAGREAGRGTGQDSGREAGRGAGQDAGQEAGRGAGQDAGQEAGRGAGQDAGREAGRGAGQDASRGEDGEAGQDVGRKAGEQAGQDAVLDDRGGAIDKDGTAYERGEMQQKDSSMENEGTSGKPYGYTFDYYKEPDLQEFDRMKKKRESEEIQEEIKKMKLLKEIGRTEKSKDGEKTGLSQAVKDVRASPDTKEKQSQFYGKEQRKDLIDEHSQVTPITDKIGGWKQQVSDNKAWREYKEAEWSGVKSQSKQSVVEAQTLETIQESRKKKEMPVSDAIEASRNAEKSEQPEVDFRLLAFDKTWLDDKEKISVVSSPSQSRKIVDDESKSRTEAEEAPVQAKFSSKLEAISEESMEPSVVTPSESDVDFAAATGDNDKQFAEVRKKYIKDICDCIPGFCTCGEKHYLFKTNRPDTFGMGFITEQKETGKQKTADADIEQLRESYRHESGDTSCTCLHSIEDAQVTPVVSRLDVVASPPPQIFEPQIGTIVRRMVRCAEPRYQKTLVIVKPEAVQYRDAIFRAIRQEGLDIVNERLVQLTPEQVAEIYSENFGSAYFPMFVQQLSASPILVLTLAGLYAVQRWKAVVGPEKSIPASWFYPASMRRRFSVNEEICDIMKISEEFQRAKTEIRYFFPFDIIDPIIISSTMIQDYCDEFIHPTLLKGLFVLVKTKPDDPVLFLAEWLLINNPFQPFYMQREVSLAAT